MSEWLSTEEFMPEEYFGFVYKITNLQSGKFYIGRKQLSSTTTKALTKTELLELSDKRMSKKKKVTKESNWKNYWGSNKDLLNDVKELGKENFKREIVKLCRTKKELTYYEMHYQCTYGVLLLPELTYNDNILGKFFPRDLIQ